MSADNRKRKKNYYKASSNKKARYGEELRPGMRGFFITCNSNERPAVMEAYRILNEYGDIKYGTEYSENGTNDENLESALQKEVSDLRKSNSKGAERRFQSVKTKTSNVIFLKTNVPDPAGLVEDIFSDIISSQIRKTKFCLRFLPVTATCYAKAEEIIRSVKPLVEPVFAAPDIEPVRFCVVWKVRCNNSIKRDDVLQPILDIISSNVEHKTDYVDPEILLNIEVVRNTCCLSILKNFLKFRKYNIDLICKPTENIGKSEEGARAPNGGIDVTSEEPDDSSNTEKCNDELCASMQERNDDDEKNGNGELCPLLAEKEESKGPGVE